MLFCNTAVADSQWCPPPNTEVELFCLGELRYAVHHGRIRNTYAWQRAQVVGTLREGDTVPSIKQVERWFKRKSSLPRTPVLEDYEAAVAASGKNSATQKGVKLEGKSESRVEEGSGRVRRSRRLAGGKEEPETEQADAPGFEPAAEAFKFLTLGEKH